MSDYELINGDCIEEMEKLIDDGVKVDMVLTDLPYGTTACKWDNVIPFDEMWKCLDNLTYDTTPIVLFGQEPFSSHLRLSNIKNYKYDWIWDKVNLYTGTLLSNKRPLKRHEIISIFYKKQPVYNKQYRKGQPYTMKRNTKGVGEAINNNYKRIKTVNTGNHNPCSILEIEGGNKSEKGLHPTQKPIKLLEYLIKTYSNEKDTVLDFTMGSGSTGVACLQTNRNFIGIELDKDYYEIAKKRIKSINK